MATPHRIESVSEDPEAALLTMGVNREVFDDAALAVASAQLSCSDFDVLSKKRWLGWCESTKSLRSSLVPGGGWTIGRDHNVEAVVSAKHAIQIICAEGDAHTGFPDKSPTTIGDKGPFTGRTAQKNSQLSFPENVSPLFKNVEDSQVETWFFLFFVDRHLKQIRWELSVPTDFSGQTSGGNDTRGYISGFTKRIIMGPVAIPELIPPTEEDHKETKIDIPVKLR